MKWAGLGILAAIIPSAASAAIQYTIRSVGPLSGGTASYGEGITVSGTVVGYSDSATTTYHAYTWSNGTSTDLGSFLGAGQPSYGFSISNAGNVAATSSQLVKTSGGDTIGGFRGMVFINGTRVELGSLGGRDSNAYGINDAGQVVGSSFTSWSSTTATHAFLWQGGTMKDLGTLAGGANSSAVAINSIGQAVGYSLDGNNHNRAVVWSGSTVADLGTLGGSNSWAFDINNAGATVGWAEDATSTRRAFVADATGMRSLGTLGTASVAYGESENGLVVGDYTSAAGQSRAFVYAGGTMQDLNSLVLPTSGWVLTDARGVNDEGQIVGSGTFNGQTVAYVLTPTPEPTSIVTAGISTFLLLLARRRHRLQHGPELQ